MPADPVPEGYAVEVMVPANLMRLVDAAAWFQAARRQHYLVQLIALGLEKYAEYHGHTDPVDVEAFWRTKADQAEAYRAGLSPRVAARWPDAEPIGSYLLLDWQAS